MESCPDPDAAEAGLVSIGLLAVVEVTVSIGAELIGLVWMSMMFYPRLLYRQLTGNTFPFQRWSHSPEVNNLLVTR
jgi:hypothetical protein